MDYQQLAKAHPVLYHMADARNWPSIQECGLLSTSALLDRLSVSGTQREAVESAHRPDAVPLEGEAGTVFVRDQHPLQPSVLDSCLDGVTPEEWYRLLNGRVFFWPTRERLEKMLAFYDSEEQAVFEVDTPRLLASHGERVELSRINSGFAVAFYRPARRGRATFVPLADFVPSSKNKIAEVTVPYAVPNIFEMTVRVTLRRRGSEERVLWKAASAST